MGKKNSAKFELNGNSINQNNQVVMIMVMIARRVLE